MYYCYNHFKFIDEESEVQRNQHTVAVSTQAKDFMFHTPDFSLHPINGRKRKWGSKNPLRKPIPKNKLGRKQL